MSIEETIKKMLFEHGMFEDQCDQVITRVKANKENSAICWQDKPEGYPEVFMSALWFCVRDEALAFIDETFPNAFFRDLFVPSNE